MLLQLVREASFLFMLPLSLNFQYSRLQLSNSMSSILQYIDDFDSYDVPRSGKLYILRTMLFKTQYFAFIHFESMKGIAVLIDPLSLELECEAIIPSLCYFIGRRTYQNLH